MLLTPHYVYASNTVQIKIENRFRQNQVIQTNSNGCFAGKPGPNQSSSVWHIEPVKGTAFFRLRNDAMPGHYIHLENGPVSCGSIPAGYWTAHWSFESIPSSGYVRIRNRFRSDQYLHLETGVLESGAVPANYWTSHWKKVAPTTDDKKQIAMNAYGETPDMCWRESYGRGAGTIPSCGAPLVNEAGLCYQSCRTGYTGAAFLCWKDCPSGFRDDGLFCAKPSAYGRGSGYPWHLGDALNLDAAKTRCEKENRQGCEKSGEIMYPRCKTGFHAVGCCICSPDCPSGMTDAGVSCAKPQGINRGVGILPTQCENGENNAGLCYPNCKSGFNGVGPVCWGNVCPSEFPVECGMSCSVSQSACVEGIFGQVLTPFEVVVNVTGMVVSGGGSAVATVGARNAVKTISKATIKKELKKIGKNLAEDTLENASATFYEAQLTGQFSWTDLDPTGIANVVKAYDKPLCKDFQ